MKIKSLKAKNDLKESEIFYRHLTQLSPDAIVIHSQGKIIFANRSCLQLVGAKKQSDIIGRDIMDFVHPDSKPLIVKRIMLMLKEKKQVPSLEEKFINLKGKIITAEVKAVPFNHKGKQAFLAILHDITKQKELEKKKDDFISTASHELKTPITSMKIYIGILEMYLKNNSYQKAKKIASSLKKQTERLNSLVTELLDVSRIETGKLKLNLEVFNLDELVEDTVENLKDITQKHEFVLRKEGDFKIKGDRFRIYQVLTNLLTNAVKYSPKGGNIVIKMQEKKGEAVISIKDHGIGIKKIEQKSIFNKLYQAPSAQIRTFSGIGMGLYISKEIINRHKGKIWVRSVEGKGSTFYFSLPLKRKVLSNQN